MRKKSPRAIEIMSMVEKMAISVKDRTDMEVSGGLDHATKELLGIRAVKELFEMSDAVKVLFDRSDGVKELFDMRVASRELSMAKSKNILAIRIY